MKLAQKNKRNSTDKVKFLFILVSKLTEQPLSLFYLEQVAGIGPANCAWEAHILPLNYTCMVMIVLIISCFLIFCKKNKREDGAVQNMHSTRKSALQIFLKFACRPQFSVIIKFIINYPS